jgi:murein DD-endopeptidase MepM/ murein hydrolase activator NlpD
VDLAAAPGQTVRAATAGRVSFAGRIAGHGVVALSHGALRTTYLPVIPSVRTGQYLPAGTRLGTVQDLPGHCGPLHCLHWGLRNDLNYLDPLSMLRPRVRLLPHWTPRHRLWPGPLVPGPAPP